VAGRAIRQSTSGGACPAKTRSPARGTRRKSGPQPRSSTTLFRSESRKSAGPLFSPDNLSHVWSTRSSEDYNLIGDDPADAVPAEPKAQPEQAKDNGNQGQAAKSDAKIIELAKIANAPAPNILGGKPSESGPDPFDVASAVVDQNYLKAAATEQMARPLKIRKPGKEFFMALAFYLPFNLYADTADGKVDGISTSSCRLWPWQWKADLSGRPRALCELARCSFLGLSACWTNRTNGQIARDAVKQATTNWVRSSRTKSPAPDIMISS
jgi:hypothetical protein